MADAGRWGDLLDFAAGPAPEDARREAAHLVAFEAPASAAAAAAELFTDDRGYLGPLWEVASHHPWRDLDPHLTDPRIRSLVTQMRVLWGEDLRGSEDLTSMRPAAPLCLEPWEAAGWDEHEVPGYARRGRSGSVWACPPDLADPARLPSTPAASIDHPAVPVLAGLSTAAQARAFRATAWEAASATAPDECSAWEIPFSSAYSDLVHLASGDRAYGGASGRAVGRVALWTALIAMAGTHDPRLVTGFVDRLRCVAWRQPAEPMMYVRLAMEDPEQGVSWVLTAEDDD
ncbi:hypothetical protein SAMN05421684_7233 [Asanoa ishikariensis]|uniref:Uncharacterized protein n=2 Tax=Asanoa ishikariensis TaxID=137265 RepID=A0A1H3UI90_9ACTN|nr:hypothetical protein SAMN05421684_7233 [Asanoa ishikariensis]